MQQPDLLRLVTMGSVDDGKSTLIGRLLLDADTLTTDQLAAAETTCGAQGANNLNLAYFTDGLKEEREQGITIDVAYRYFSTLKRRFILADSPGHVEFTRNLFTGASSAEVAIILVDVRNGVVEQTRRHLYIASLLQLDHVIICINKMDLVNYQQSKFDAVAEQVMKLSSQLKIKHTDFFPISALKGDNIVHSSGNMPWFKKAPLLTFLENLPQGKATGKELRLPVQQIIFSGRSTGNSFTGVAGRVEQGFLEKGQEVRVMPSGLCTKVKAIHDFGQELNVAEQGRSVTFEVQDEVEVKRGDVITDLKSTPFFKNTLTAELCWLSLNSMQAGQEFLLKSGTNTLTCTVSEIIHQFDLFTYKKVDNPEVLKTNEMGTVRINLSEPLIFDLYKANKTTGCLILIDMETNETMAGGVILA